MHDLRSDTVTRPTDAMRAAMAAAEVGDDVFGDDPTTNDFERFAADLLGKPAALFVPSGTMGNQLCLGVLTRPGDEIIGESACHILQHEVGSAARLWGATIRTVQGTRGLMDPADVEAIWRDDDIHHPRTAVLSLENTHNFAGGVVLPQSYIDDFAAMAHERGASVHLDGARLMNAVVASGTPAARMLRDVDMVSVCLSKGLGAPVGSVVAGSVEHIGAARKLRKALGGGMRQVGVLTAAARIALEEGPAALEDDHRRARELAVGLDALDGIEVDVDTVQTNIVFATMPDGGATAFADRLAADGVASIAIDDRTVRFVFHRDAGDDALAAALASARAARA